MKKLDGLNQPMKRLNWLRFYFFDTRWSLEFVSDALKTVKCVLRQAMILATILATICFSVTEKQSTVESVKHYVSARFECFGEFWKA